MPLNYAEQFEIVSQWLEHDLARAIDLYYLALEKQDAAAIAQAQSAMERLQRSLGGMLESFQRDASPHAGLLQASALLDVPCPDRGSAPLGHIPPTAPPRTEAHQHKPQPTEDITLKP